MPTIFPSPHNIKRRIFSQTASGTIANSVTETDITSTGVGSKTLPINFLTVGKTLEIVAWGFHSSVSTPTIRIRVKLGSTTVLDTGAVNCGNGTNDSFRLMAVLTCRSVGGSGTVFAQGSYEELHVLGTRTDMPNTTTTTIDTTATQAITVTAQWGTASASNTITMTNFTIDDNQVYTIL